MQIAMRYFSPSRDGARLRTSTGFIGTAKDDRGRHANALLSDNAEQIHTIQYIHERITVELDGRELQLSDLSRELGNIGDSVSLDVTTLNIAEMLILLRILSFIKCPRVIGIYVEPEAYHQPNSDGIIRRRDFELTENRHKFTSVEGHFYLLGDNNHDAVFLVGFENERLFQALEEHQIDPRYSNVVFGVPAFKVGWEMHSFANHIRLLRDHGIGSRVQFCPADNPLATFEYLDKVRNRKKSTNRMFVLPLGTQPQTFGTALFLNKHQDVGLLYDFPVSSSQPSMGVGRTHLFEIGGL